MNPRPIMLTGVLCDTPYIDPPTIPVGQTICEYRECRICRPPLWLRILRRLHVG